MNRRNDMLNIFKKTAIAGAMILAAGTALAEIS